MLRWFHHVLRLPRTRIGKQVLSEFRGGGGTTPWPSAAKMVQDVKALAEIRLVTPGSLQEIAEHRAK
ncbi:UNVERIFIED_CONTAM: hypothetical protein PYX00_000308 [Menopon gallinae]|uniref:Uncharacterized protein n=1 Tax=Menopon gallinae TaxID=328185 RepID=A0AAW2I8R2_9NEOP